METPEQAARYWQMRHAEAQIELAKGTRRILEMQAEVAALSKHHVDAAADFTKELEGLRFELDLVGVPTHRDGQKLTLQQRAAELQAKFAEEKRERAKWESYARAGAATIGECHELIEKAAIPGLERDRMQSLQGCIRALLELAAKPVHVAPPPADTASCEQHLQERIEELEAELKAARAEIADVHRGLDATGVYAQATTLTGQRLLSPRERIDRLTARAVELADCINAPASNVGVYGRMASAICGVTYGGIGLRCAPEAADPHPAIDSIHAALDRAGVSRDEPAATKPHTRPRTPQSRIENLAAQRDTYRDLLELVRADLRCGKQEVTADVAKRCREDSDLLAWLDKVGDLVVLNLRVGPVCVKRGATGTHKTLRDALEAIRNSEIESAVRKEAVK